MNDHKSKQCCLYAKIPSVVWIDCISNKTYKSKFPLDRGLLLSEGHRSHQTRGDGSKSDSFQLNTNCLSHTQLNPFNFFIVFITRFPVHTKLVPVKKRFTVGNGLGVCIITTVLLSTSHHYLYNLILIWGMVTPAWTSQVQNGRHYLVFAM